MSSLFPLNPLFAAFYLFTFSQNTQDSLSFQLCDVRLRNELPTQDSGDLFPMLSSALWQQHGFSVCFTEDADHQEHPEHHDEGALHMWGEWSQHGAYRWETLPWIHRGLTPVVKSFQQINSIEWTSCGRGHTISWHWFHEDVGCSLSQRVMLAPEG